MAWTSSSTMCPVSLSVPLLATVLCKRRERCSQRLVGESSCLVRAEKVRDRVTRSHFQLCLEVRVPRVVMSAVSACSTGLEKDLNHTGRVSGWVTQRNSAQEWSLPFLPLHTLPRLFCKLNTAWASPSLEGNSGECLAYLYSRNHHLYALPPLPMTKLLHRNIPRFSEFINLFSKWMNRDIQSFWTAAETH